MILAKIWTTFSMSLVCIAIALSSIPSAFSKSTITYHNCQKTCQARTMLSNLKPYKLPTRSSGLSNPLGSDVCKEHLNGSVKEVQIKRKKFDVCQFKDKSFIELSELHKESERLAIP
jgi:hypothetical protein